MSERPLPPPVVAAVPSVGDVHAAETRPPGADRYATWWKVWLPIPILFLLLDVTFNLWFWQIPKLSGSAADYSYQYLYDLEHLRGTKSSDRIRIVAFGSSVSSAFDPWQVQSLLEARETADLEVWRLTKPGSKPSDHRLVWQAELEDVQPDIAVIVFNLVDFLNPSFERVLKPDIRYVLPPWAALTQRWKYIPTVAEKLELAVASVSSLYRFRKPIQSALEDHGKALWRWWRSAGAGGGYGWYADGYTEERFAIPIGGANGGSFEYFVDPAWIEQRGRIRLRFTLDGRRLAEREETTPGWKRLPLGAETGLLQVAADSAWNRRAAGRGQDVRLLGVRLREVPAEALNHGQPPFRYQLRAPSDADEFLRMGDATGAAYVAKWQTALGDSGDFARRFRAYRDVKLALRGRRFEPVGEFAELKRMAGELAAAGVAVVLVNTPESSLLEGLDHSAYYQDYLQFFRAVARDTPGVRFVDLHDALPPEDLNDWHHVNYIGQIKLGPVFADVLAEQAAAMRVAAGGGSDAL